jgi:hypothetical protein
MFRLRAREAFRYNCELLKRSKDVFWSAKVTFGLGERMLREMERAATTIVREAPPTPLPSDPSPSEPTPDVATFTPGMDRPGYHHYTDGLQNLDAMDMNLDVFGYLDPSFDLTMAENALEGNLDLGMPLNWGDWEQFGQGP